MRMTNSEPVMDILDGSDVDEDNVGDVDVDQENVLLESDDEESHPSHQLSKTMGGRSYEERRRVEEEEDDVLNIVLQGDEELLDYGGDDNEEDGVNQRLPPVKVRSSLVTGVLKEPSHFEQEQDDNDATAGPSSNYDDNMGGASRNDDNFGERQYPGNEDEDYEDGDEETETRTRSRFTTERNVESRGSGSGGGHSSGTSSIQTIQTLGEHKVRPNMNMPDGRPRHWNHNNGPRQGGLLRPNGPRHPGGRNHRFPPPRLGPPGENPHMRPMQNPPVVQFNEGLFTDFNQPIRHSHQGPRPRQSPPGPPQHPPRNNDTNMHRHPMPPNSMNNNMRPNFPPQMPQQQPRPFFPSPPDNQMRQQPPRMQPPGPPGHISHQHQSQQQQPPHRQPHPDFNMRGQQRPPRFPPNNMHPNQRHPRPHNNMNQHPNMQRPDRPPFPPRQHRPPFRPDMPHQDPMGMPPQRFPPQQGFPPQQPPHNGPPGFIPPHLHSQHPPRFMGPHGGGPPPDGPHNAYYMQQHGGPGNFNHPPIPGEQVPYPHEAPWQGPPEHMPPSGPGAPQQNPNHPANWSHHQQQQQHPHHQQQPLPPHPHQNYNGIGGAYNNQNAMYEQAPQRPPVHHNPILGQQPALPIAAALQNAHSLELPPTTSKSIYIKPNSEIHEALSRGGHFRHLKEEDRRHEGSSSSHGAGTSGTSSSSKHYDDYEHDHHHHYHDRDRDRDRSSSSRRPSSPDRRRDRDRDDDDYYDDRRKSSSYHHYDDRDRDSRRPRRKYEEDSRDRRHRSDSPEKKMSRSDNYDRDRDRGRDKDREPVHNKESVKLMEEAKSLGLGEDYVRKLEEQRQLRERILKTKEQRRKQVKVPGTPDNPSDPKSRNVASSSAQKCVENEADSTVASGKGAGNSSSGGGAVAAVGKTKKVLRIVKDKSGKVISKKVHVVVVGKHQDVHQSSATS